MVTLGVAVDWVAGAVVTLELVARLVVVVVVGATVLVELIVVVLVAPVVLFGNVTGAAAQPAIVNDAQSLFNKFLMRPNSL